MKVGAGRDRSDSISFTEFMSLTEGDAVTFDEYMQMVTYTGGNLGSVAKVEYDKASKAYTDVATGVKLLPDSPDRLAAASSSFASTSSAAAGSNAPPTAPPPQAAPSMPAGVVRAQCFNCKSAFGVPAGAQACACPHCGSVNNVIRPQVQQCC